MSMKTKFNPFVPVRKWSDGNVTLAYGHYKLSHDFIWQLTVGKLTLELMPEQFNTVHKVMNNSTLWLQRK